MLIKNYIETVAKLIPIEWDRFVENNGDYDIYGWIKRKDGQRDFVLFQLYIENGEIKGSYCTSSAKYSKDIYMCLYGTTAGHNTCQKIERLVV